MDQEKLRQFLNELTNLSHRYGLGITGDAILYELEREDSERNYHCNDDSELEFV